VDRAVAGEGKVGVESVVVGLEEVAKEAEDLGEDLMGVA